MRFGSLFSGIGGLDLGLERAGMECAWQVEIDDYCQRVLEKHWPDVPKYRDVKDVGRHNLEPVDFIAGGFPCQPFSVAGSRLGKDDPRWLWPEMARIIAETKPAWVLAENPPGISPALGWIRDDLEGLGYEILCPEIPAEVFGAWHLRYRTFIIAHSDGKRQQNGARITRQAKQERRAVTIAGPYSEQMERSSKSRKERISWENEPDVGRVVHGISRRVDRLTRKRVAALGNAVVPQVAEWIGKRIMEHDQEKESTDL